MNNSTNYRSLQIAFWVIPLITMSVAYLAICYYAGNLWPWYEIVHETGDRSLINTVLYYEHAARELPLDIILGVAIAASVLFVFPQQGNALPSRKILSSFVLLAIAIVLIVTIILTGTVLTGGGDMLSNNLLQMHTRPGEPLNWGSHWRYHLLSRLTLMFLSMGFAGLLLLVTKGRSSTGNKTGVRVFFIAIAIFALLTIIFIPDMDPFFDAVFLGHQVREVFTHLLVTVPIAWAVCLKLANHDKSASAGTASIKLWPAIAGILGIVLGLYLLMAGLNSSSASQGQTTNLILLVCPHFFEHSFSYLVVPLVAGFTFQANCLKGKAEVSG